MLAKLLQNWKIVLISILITQCTGFLSSILAGHNVKAKYLHYNLPLFSPPEWVFAVTWIILYLLIGTALGLFISTHTSKQVFKKGIALYFIQLFLNFIWSIVFFRLELMFLSIINILALDFFAIKTMFFFKKTDKNTLKLLLPYILWLLFATYLNIAIVLLN